ncbi:hypothetical protein Tco_1233351, partial [Tanacetum coccineum]
MRNQRQSRVPLRYEDTVHNINNSKSTKRKTASNKKDNGNSKGSLGENEEFNSKEKNVKENNEVDNNRQDVNVMGVSKEKSVNLVCNGLETVENNEVNKGVFGNDDNEEQVSNDFTCDTPVSSLQHDNYDASRGNLDVNNKDDNCNISIDDNLNEPAKTFSYASMVRADDIPKDLEFIPTII